MGSDYIPKHRRLLFVTHMRVCPFPLWETVPQITWESTGSSLQHSSHPVCWFKCCSTQSLFEVMKLGISSVFLGGLVDELQRTRFPNGLVYIVFRALLYCDLCKWLMIWSRTETHDIFNEHIMKNSKIHMVSTSVLLLPWDGNHWWPITSSWLHVPVTNI